MFLALMLGLADALAHDGATCGTRAAGRASVALTDPDVLVVRFPVARRPERADFQQARVRDDAGPTIAELTRAPPTPTADGGVTLELATRVPLSDDLAFPLHVAMTYTGSPMRCAWTVERDGTTTARRDRKLTPDAR